jgi:hypothetical protein
MDRLTHMTTFYTASAHWMRPLAGLAAAVALAVALFSTGLAAMDHFTSLSVGPIRTGSFSAQSQGDYAASAAKRLAPQRATIRSAS